MGGGALATTSVILLSGRTPAPVLRDCEITVPAAYRAVEVYVIVPLSPRSARVSLALASFMPTSSGTSTGAVVVDGVDVGRGVRPREPAAGPKLKALAVNPTAALTIDDNTWPHKVLLVRGSATVELLDDVSPEYAAAAERYFGTDRGQAWVSRLHGRPMARVALRPRWVGVLDFETRFPSAISL